MIERMRASLEDYKVQEEKNKTHFNKIFIITFLFIFKYIFTLQAANEEAVAKTAEVFKEGKKLSILKISKKSISPLRLVCHPALSALTCLIWQWEVVC